MKKLLLIFYLCASINLFGQETILDPINNGMLDSLATHYGLITGKVAKTDSNIAGGYVSYSFARNASNLDLGTLPTGRLSGSYTGITGLGTVTAGVWNGTSIADAYVDDNITVSDYLPLAGGTLTGALNVLDTINGMHINLANTVSSKANTAVGYNALQNLDYANRADYSIGSHSYTAATQATENTAFGMEALREATLPSDNTAVGSRALRDLTLGYHNTAVGHYSQGFSITGVQNTSIGTFSLKELLTGEMNVAVGMEALVSNKYGNENVAIGKQAMYYNIEGNYNTAVGRSALHYNKTNNNNTAIGYFCLYDLVATHDTITAFVNYSGTVAGTVKATSTGHGRSTGNSLIISGSTDYDGTYTITVIDTDNFYFTDTYVGNETVGFWTLTGQEGKNNVAVGYQTGRGITYGSGNTIIGANVQGLTAGLSNNIIIADGAGNIKAQHSGTAWTLNGGTNLYSSTSVNVLNMYNTDNSNRVTHQFYTNANDAAFLMYNSSGTGTIRLIGGSSIHSYINSGNNLNIGTSSDLGYTLGVSGTFYASGSGTFGGGLISESIYPETDNTFYLGKNDDDTPFAWKGLVLKDQTDGKYYRVELNSGTVSIVDLTD